MIYNALKEAIAKYLYDRDFPGNNDFDQLVVGKEMYYSAAKDILSIIGIVEEGNVAQGE